MYSCVFNIVIFRCLAGDIGLIAVMLKKTKKTKNKKTKQKKKTLHPVVSQSSVNSLLFEPAIERLRVTV